MVASWICRKKIYLLTWQVYHIQVSEAVDLNHGASTSGKAGWLVIIRKNI